jgi:phage shock protein E
MDTNLIILGGGAIFVVFLVVRRIRAAAAARALIESGATVIDVRSKPEWDQGHLDVAHLIPLPELGGRMKEVAKLSPDKGAPIVVYCRSGARSAQAKAMLEQAGYTAVTNGGGYASLR